MRTLTPKGWIVRSTSGGLRLLQMILESDIEGCANENAGPKGWIVKSTGGGLRLLQMV